MDINSIIHPTPTEEKAPEYPLPNDATQSPSQERKPSMATVGSIPPPPTTVAPSPTAQNNALKSEHSTPDHHTTTSPHLSTSSHTSLSQQRATSQSVGSVTPDSRKRPLESSQETPTTAQPPKRQKTESRRMAVRPPWAIYSKHNQSRYNPQGVNGMHAPAKPQQNGARQSNGQPSSHTSIPEEPAWRQEPPLDDDLMYARSILGKWEKTFKWNTPYPDLLRQVQDWLFVQLDQLQDVGTDPREGTIEIEAKVGTILNEDGNDRWKLPVLNTVVVDPKMNNRLNFESRMNAAEHQAMNQYLNEATQKSCEKGRARIAYKHLHETDSFYSLSQQGLDALPESLLKRSARRPPRLRITTETGHPNKVLARIVKVPISNLHIYNPSYNYDCRISINLEVNLMRPGLNPEDLIAAEQLNSPDSAAQTREVDRVKDRLSYKHLAYSIDLTKVDRKGLGSTYELELEVDSHLLRQQMHLLKTGQPSAYGDVVSGFLDNANFLMRQQARNA